MCSQADELSPLLAQFNDSRLEMAPLDFMYPLAWNLFVFEDGDGTTQLTVTGNLPGLVIIPSVMGNKKLYLGTLLADLCSRVLGEFGRVVRIHCISQVNIVSCGTGANVGDRDRK
jgi:trafficking protein particle complex subunit 9